MHTVAIWTFTFHQISGFERVILKVNFNPIYRQKLSILLSENACLFYPFFFYFLQNLSNPVLFTHCCCYSKELTCLNCDLMQKYMRINLTFINSHPQLRSHYLCHSTVAVSRHTGLKKYTYLLVHSTTLP